MRSRSGLCSRVRAGARSCRPSSSSAQPPFDAQTREYVKRVRARTHEVLESVRHALPEDVVAESRSIDAGSTARGLHEAAEEEGASLIVIGSTHRGPLGRVVIGSVGELLLSATPCAVAVAPHGFRDRKPDSIGVVGVGFSGSDESRDAFDGSGRHGARRRGAAPGCDGQRGLHPCPSPASRPGSRRAVAAGPRAGYGAEGAEIVSLAGDPCCPACKRRWEVGRDVCRLPRVRADAPRSARERVRQAHAHVPRATARRATGRPATAGAP